MADPAPIRHPRAWDRRQRPRCSSRSGRTTRLQPRELAQLLQAQTTGIRRYAADLEPTAAVDPEYATWMLLGPARLHYTLANADIISKRNAGEYVKANFRNYASLAERAIHWRTGNAVSFTVEDLVSAASLTDLIADEAWSRWG